MRWGICTAELSQGQVKYGHNNMLHECRATHVLWGIRDVEFNGDILFYFTQVNVKVRSEFEISKFRNSIFLQVHAYLQIHIQISLSVFLPLHSEN